MATLPYCTEKSVAPPDCGIKLETFLTKELNQQSYPTVDHNRSLPDCKAQTVALLNFGAIACEWA